MGGSEQGSGGTPTTDLNRTGTQTGDPALETLADDNQSFTETPAGTVMGGDRAAGEPPTGAGIETGSSPANHPGAPASDLVEGLEMSGGAGASTPQVGMPSESPSPQMDVPDSFKP